MQKRTILILLAAVMATVACGAASFAQTPPPPPPILPEPEQGVRGMGAIPGVQGAIGMFDINVWRASGTLYGGFQYKEANPSIRRVTIITTKTITEMKIEGNFAVIKAFGTWNGMPANLTIEALDDNPSGDWFHIVAQPLGPMTVIFDRSGGVMKGDIVVFSQPPPPDLHAKGEGTIVVSNTGIGKFQFSAGRMMGIIGGGLMYAEISPVLTPLPIRPRVRIGLPMVRRLEVIGNTALFSGIGTFNAVPALIEVKVTDNSMLDSPIPIPDQFAIRATPATTTSIVPTVLYEAGGPLKSGDIFVITVPIK